MPVAKPRQALHPQTRPAHHPKRHPIRDRRHSLRERSDPIFVHEDLASYLSLSAILPASALMSLDSCNVSNVLRSLSN